MENSVIIKGNPHGIVVVLDKDLPFSELKEHIKEKFSSSSNFLGNAQMAVCFEGRTLNDDEKREVLNIISENSELDIVCIIENDAELDERFEEAARKHLMELEQAANERLMELENRTGQFVKGNIRSGQVLDMQTSVVILGDVNPGASVSSTGNIVVLGALKGTAFAGCTGNENAFVYALDLSPVQIRIAGAIARCPDEKPNKNEVKEPKIAFLEDGNIYIETVNKKVLNDIVI